ncbi:hypothetical protein GS429_14840 [Natronorubrum sp. JWXQ-INN-674]|uniref:RecR protein domain-containing protein n=1 Tax=Natronorubrum halalkaliphilum TaxID=2691917 RepID=A0A6B0VS35_9EURY|nr:hypothetical protein [Natronorubrum halalkaliphilum]
MSECSIDGCGHEGAASTWFRCSYCGRQHCSGHRLPERHDCTALAHAQTLGPELREYVEDSGVLGNTESSPNTSENEPVKQVQPEENDFGEPSSDTTDRVTTSTTESVAGSTRQSLRKQTCEDCGSEIATDRDQCPICEQLEDDGIEKTTCEDCSSMILADKTRCVHCRRQHQLIDSRSPDVSPTGELVYDGDNEDGTERDSDGSKSVWSLMPNVDLRLWYVRIRPLLRVLIVFLLFAIAIMMFL